MLGSLMSRNVIVKFDKNSIALQEKKMKEKQKARHYCRFNHLWFNTFLLKERLKKKIWTVIPSRIFNSVTVSNVC